ncbi:SH3 domain-containing protein [Duganella qianjiadongensis]|uniref:SH3 domain-containing protein n=1 Tax=Duganella qianjiadongensis TaxID=2692176 RepID=A0ABW9VDV0_9BURK|nr:SH3 domain-containing protein [Duganella qianjiadongensis]MYM37751.1 SH3 domain-containing protein [Duganella qianjiadongensis]
MSLAQAATYLVALAATLVVAAYCTPRSWWRRLNLRALAFTLGGTLLFGHLFMPSLIPAPARAETSSNAATPPAAVDGMAGVASAITVQAVRREADADGLATQAFSVHRDLNLRRAAGVDARRVLTIPAGAVVSPTGLREGDWWQINACLHGKCNTGWVSSLWLRRHDEQGGTVHEH